MPKLLSTDWTSAVANSPYRPRQQGEWTAGTLKLIAMVSMLIDHTGYILFPQVIVLRWIGRLAFPLFLYFLSR